MWNLILFVCVLAMLATVAAAAVAGYVAFGVIGAVAFGVIAAAIVLRLGRETEQPGAAPRFGTNAFQRHAGRHDKI
ncbi:hypothetical protein [Tropicimonas sp. IMCC34043]|uniref:hypothetical protein n=1 Tax=Tropicimonas sp. IMCC34043 TaxID=2248760 RepID=UPI000E24257F|nr:hypothetical protein [Tropicimonas sp. IMCC34043]